MLCNWNRQLSWGSAGLAITLSFAYFAGAGTAHGQTGGDGFEWATIGALGNPAYSRIDQSAGHLVAGHGAVAHEFRMSKLEVTSAQWLSFYNAALGREHPIPFVDYPVFWGGTFDPDYHGPGSHFKLVSPQSGMWPSIGMPWRTAAIFCNWLCNDRRTDESAFLTGAYSVSTFGNEPDGVSTDQADHTPGARYWIPTQDERLKAVYYDADKNGQGSGGWWLYPNRSDSPPIYGPPGVGQANARFELPNHGEYEIPLGAYPTQLTPWGLLDAAGAASEFTETVLYYPEFSYRARLTGGSYPGISSGYPDRADGGGDVLPDYLSTEYGLRIASIPEPSAFGVVAMFLLGRQSRRRRVQ